MTLQLQTAGVNVVRDKHWALNPVSGLYEKATLLEGQSTNLFTRSAPTKTQCWSVHASVVDVVLAAFADAGLSSTALNFPGGTGGTIHCVPSAFTTVVGTTYTLSVYVVMDDGGAPVPGASTNAAADFTLVIDNNTSTPQGTVTRMGTSNVYRVRATFTAASGSTSNGLFRYVGQSQRGFTVTGWQLDPLPVASSFILTAGAAVTRSADNAYLSLPSGLTTPQALSLYMKKIEGGTSSTPQGRILHLGASGGVGDRLIVRRAVASAAYIGDFTAGGTTVTTGQTLPTPSIGDQVELLLTLSAAGVVSISQSINGGALATTTDAAPVALPAAWGDTKLWVGSVNGTSSGFFALLALKAARGVKSMAQMRAF